jgi:hypothetical protein
VSEQYEGCGGRLGERFGLVDFQFRLEVVNHALCFHQAGAAFSVGPLHLPLPHWLAPQVTAREWVLPGQRRVQVAVSVRIPLAGLLLAYEGWIDIEEGEA